MYIVEKPNLECHLFLKWSFIRFIDRLFGKKKPGYTLHILAGFVRQLSLFAVIFTNFRKWNRELWKEIFDAFLNIPDCENLPSLQQFEDRVRKEFLRTADVQAWNAEMRMLQALFH